MDKHKNAFPKRLARTTIYESRWVNLHRDRVELSTGNVIDQYHVVEFETGAVSVIVENANGQVLMERMSRYPVGTTTWELPAGGMEQGESAIEAAKREVFEETGFETHGHDELYQFHPLNGISNKLVFVVQCQVGQEIGRMDANEVDAIRWFSADELKELIDRREITDSFTLISLLLLFAKKV